MFEGINLENLTAPGLLGLVVLMILFGRIIPRSTLQDKSDESERWRSAYEAERTARSLTDQQTAELLELAKTTHAIVAAIFPNGKMIRPPQGDTDVVSQERPKD